MSSKSISIKKLILSAVFTSVALVLPFVTGNIPQIGNALCPMHIPVILCGFFCGPIYALVVGFISPLLRLFLFGAPLLIPTGAAMCFELATYGVISGLLYRALPKKRINIYLSLVVSMLCGRIVWGIARVILFGLGKSEFGWKAFLTGAFLGAIPGIVIQLILIPIIVMALKRYTDKK